jgi:diguanylate cyclase (GGDEF)-like protein
LSDELTGLGNRRAFFTFGEQRMQSMERTASLGVLIFADVDGLKEVNDSVGHEIGDALLIDAARALRTTFRRTDLIARLGGDEFVVLADVSTEEDVHFVCDDCTPNRAPQREHYRRRPTLGDERGRGVLRGAQPSRCRSSLPADAWMLQHKKCGRGRATPGTSSTRRGVSRRTRRHDRTTHGVTDGQT